MKNVEIKAKIENKEKFLEILETMQLGEAKVIKQHDIFYNSPKGRLKMRAFEDNHAELIFYERIDTEGPKLSTYDKMDLVDEDVQKLSNILSQSLGIVGEVRKTRHLYLLGQTRIHVDSVEDLGDFLELEVVLKPNQSAEEGQNIAESIMAQLNISSNDLISCAYMDLLRRK